MKKHNILLLIAIITTISSFTNSVISQTIDVGVTNISPLVIATDSTIQDVIVEIYNNGQSAVSNILLWYALNGGNPVWDTIASTILPGDTVVFTFTQQVIVPGWLSISFISVYVDYPGDTNAINDVNWWSHNPYGEMCVGAFPYGQPNSPLMPGELIYAYDSDWWSFELLNNHTNVTVSLCGSSFDTKLYVYHDCNSNYIGYNDDYCGLQSELYFTYLSAGTYYAKIQGYDTTSYGSYILNITGTPVYPPPSLEVIVTNVSCNGGSDGAVDLTFNPLSGMTLPFMYQWSNNQTTQDLANLSSGIYEVTITDAIGTQLFESVTVSEPDVIALSKIVSDVNLMGGNDGGINIQANGGVTPYNYLWSTGDQTEDLDSLFGGYYELTVTDDNGCSHIESTMINTPNPPGWNPVNSNDFHVIEIPATTSVSLDLQPLIPGSYLGLFYDSLGTQACAGVTVWSGSNTQIIAYADSGAMNSGFEINETFSWKIWDMSTASFGEYAATAVYDNSFQNLGEFAINGLSGLFSISAISNNLQWIYLREGWSLISTYLDLYESNIDSVFDPVVNELIICKNGEGLAYWPAYGVNLIDSIILGKGYQLKMVSNQNLPVHGDIVIPANISISIPQGWSYLGYLRNIPGTVENMLSSILSNMEIVKDDDGNVYWPQYGVNLIGEMLPGKGYIIKTDTTLNFSYPAY